MESLYDKIKEEGDYYEWEYTAENSSVMKCYLQRHGSMKHLCGYVVLTEDNKFWYKDYDEVPVQVHGGLTYASSDENDNWILGFDCAHSGDLVPSLQRIHLNINDVYRDKEYVISECQSLAEQLSEWSISKIRDIKLGKLV
jgi:hypothetical protein